MQTGYTGTLQYCGECNACDGSGTVPVVTDEERAALRSACSKCGGLVRLELRCEACGDMPAGMSGEWSDEQERAMVDRLKNRVGELGDERDRLLGELRSSRQLDALTIRSMRTQRDRAVALLREVCETSYDDLAALRGNINAACDWLESLEEGGS